MFMQAIRFCRGLAGVLPGNFVISFTGSNFCGEEIIMATIAGITTVLARFFSIPRELSHKFPLGRVLGILIVCAFFGANALAAGPPRRIAFVRGDNIWVVNLDGTGARKVTPGSAPNISPDGTRIVFDTVRQSAYEHAANGTRPETHLAIVDLASAKLTILKDIPSEKAFDPVWSQDGKWIAFQSRHGSPQWVDDLAMIKDDGTGFKVIKQGSTPLVSSFACQRWARDGQSIFCRDSGKLYRLGLDGTVLAQWEISKIVPFDSMGGGNIDVSPDGGRLLLTVDYRKNDEAPPPSLWSFDLATQTAVRLPTPKELSVGEGCWSDNGDILLSTGSPDEPGAIYSMSINGKNVKRLVENGRELSALRVRGKRTRILVKPHGWTAIARRESGWARIIDEEFTRPRCGS